MPRPLGDGLTSFTRTLWPKRTAVPGGRERTADEYGELLAGAGLRLERVVPTASPVSIVEAVPDRA